MARYLFPAFVPVILAGSCSSDSDVGAESSPAATTTPSTTTRAASVTSSAEPVAGGAGIGDRYHPGLGNKGYDVEHYLLELDFDPVMDRLVARATITAVAVDALASFNLDWELPGGGVRPQADGLTIDTLSVDGAGAAFTLAHEELSIVPADPIPAGARFTVGIEYSGVPRPNPYPTSYFSQGWINTESNQAFVVAIPDGAHTWFPSNDHPLDKATYEFRVTVPSGFTAAANGTLISSRLAPDGDIVWIWEMDDPMATYLATVVIGEFDVVVDDLATADAGVLIRHVLPRGAIPSDWPDLAGQGVMLAFLAELFGPYPVNAYGIAIVDEFGAAL